MGLLMTQRMGAVLLVQSLRSVYLCLDCAVCNPSAAAGEEQLNWLDERLTESDGERFRVVMIHFPLNSYTPGLAGRRQKSFVRDSLKQQKILEKHKNILFIS